MEHVWQAGREPTSAKDKPADANAVDATPDNIEAFGEKVRVHVCPSNSSSDFDSPFFLVEGDVPETGHRYLNTTS